MRACKTSGDLAAIKEYARLAEVLSRLRGLDFGINQSWSASDKSSYKGCEPMKRGRRPVHCD